MRDTPFRKPMLVFWLLLLLMSILGAGLAWAHAEYERSEPAAGAVIPESPLEVQVWFSQELFRRADANTLEVYGPDGAQVDQRDARIDDDDRRHMIVSLPAALPAGKYTVRWRTLSAEDGDTDSGEFAFTVDPAAAGTTLQASPTATPAATSMPVSEPTPSPTPLSSSTPSSQPGGGLPCLSGMVLAGLLLGLVVVSQRK